MACNSAGLKGGQGASPKSDHLADGYDADDSGGVLSGLLAEEDELDRRALWRIGSWGAGATGAVILAVMANQSSLGLKRDQVAAADLTRQAQQIQSVARETQNEARRLAHAIDTLNSDRDRLYSRVTSLELGLESATGAIARQGSSPAPPATTTEPHAAESPPAPALAPVGTTQAAPVSDKPAASTAEPGPATVSSVAKGAKADIAKADAARIETARTEAGAPRQKPQRLKPPRPKLPGWIAERPTPQSLRPQRLRPRRR